MFANRIQENTATTGTGSYALGGAVPGFRTFANAMSIGQQTSYCCALGSSWEIGLGTLSGATTLTRDNILKSSNADEAVSWGAGPKSIFINVPSDYLKGFAPIGSLVPMLTSTPNLVTVGGVDWLRTGVVALQDDYPLSPVGLITTVTDLTLPWTQRAIPYGSWQAIIWTGSAFYAVADGSAATSPDGITWTQRTLPLLSTNWGAIAWSGSVFCVCSYIPSNIVVTSADGITWTQRTMPVSANWPAIAWNGSVFCAVSDGGIAATSSNGITWTQRTLPGAASYHGITWNGSIFCAPGYYSTSSATSSDGITWTQGTMPVSASWSSPEWNGSVFCAVATGSANAATSADGITWTQRTLPASANWMAVAWNESVFCAIGYTSGAVAVAATSSDGITWTQGTMPVSAYWTALAWGGKVFCSVGSNSPNIAITSGLAETSYAGDKVPKFVDPPDNQFPLYMRVG